MRRLTPALFLLVLANLVPIFGVLFFGWRVADILILYWLENLVIGALNIPKMWACKGNPFNKLFLTAFFTVHFGMFCYGHGMIISEVFAGGGDDILAWFGLLGWEGGALFRWGMASIFVSHLISFFVNFLGKREYADRNVNTQMFLPYGRIVIMHVVVLIGGLLVQSLGSPLYALFILIGFKIFIDGASHIFEHRDKTIEMKD